MVKAQGRQLMDIRISESRIWENRMHGLMREHWGRKDTGIPEKLAEPVLYSTLFTLSFSIAL